jgi:hypothetical protein
LAHDSHSGSCAGYRRRWGGGGLGVGRDDRACAAGGRVEYGRRADRIIPEFQHLKVGDEIAMPGYTMRVELLDPQRAMAIRSSDHAWVWSFELRPTNGHTRLIGRNRFDTAALPVKDKLAYPIIEPGSWVMERKMLRTIKQRAERLAGN